LCPPLENKVISVGFNIKEKGLINQGIFIGKNRLVHGCEFLRHRPFVFDTSSVVRLRSPPWISPDTVFAMPFLQRSPPEAFQPQAA
jgi:hypothetical protein